jgi:hypothetical protein
MASKEVKTELHRIYIENIITHKDYNAKLILEGIIKDFFKLNKFVSKKNEKIFKVDNNKICWIHNYSIDSDLLNVTVKYLVHNKNVNIRNAESLALTGHKSKDEGDEEKQHFTIKFYKKFNQCVIAFENTQRGIKIKYLKMMLKEYVEYILERKYKLEDIQFKIFSIPDKDFIEQIVNLERISLLSITVDSEKVTNDEDVIFSGDNQLRGNYDIIFRPKFRGTISKKKMIKYYQKFLNDDNVKEKVKRITVDGRNSNGKLKLDTDEIILHQYIKVDLNNDNVVSTSHIFIKMRDLLKHYFKDYLKDVLYIEE